MLVLSLYMEEERKKSESATREEKVLEFWKENGVFEQTLKKESPNGEFVFYEGPPTANGKPGIHHLEARAFKDAIPRYKTMQGFHVRRKGGWDTHGLPVELQVEKKLGLNSKKAIEEYGVAKFNKECKESVWEYLDIWNKFTKRIGYWVDQENPYVTYHNDYIESVWNVFKNVNEQKLLYKDYRIVPWCPRCGTALSSHELAQEDGYQLDKDLSVTAKFKIKGVENGYFIAWTTTPWTLPGNVALAVGKDIIYVEAKVGSEILVLAKDRLSVLTEPYEIIAEHKGSEMLGMEYEPLYPFFSEKISDSEKPKLEKAFKVYEADFVNTEDGTGIVHTAVMYGQDDFVLGTALGLPKFHLVNAEGHFLSGMDFLSDRFVKDEEVAVDIIKDLAHRGLLFKKEKYEHSYPHCWRCKTPLIYYARDSWYIRMSDESIKSKLIEENKSINWEPSYIRDGRFGEWLKDIKDWAISRERYWGTPLPIWQRTDGTFEVIGSLGELKQKTKKSGNKYFVMRHGEAENNVTDIISCKPNDPYHLTEEGKEQAKKSAESLLDKKIDLIFVSDFVRTQETAEIVRETLSLSKDTVILESRLREYNVGVFHSKTWTEFSDTYLFPTRFIQTPEGGETFTEIKNRTTSFLYDIEKQYMGKNILFVGHSLPLALLISGARGFSQEQIIEIKKKKEIFYFNPAEVRQFDFVPLPHNENYELDFHKPFIDDVKLVSEDGQEMTRVKEVMDVWFDSGAMPFAQDHYPFENKEWVDGKGFPADYISEAIDQTRGWFYTLHAVGVLIGRGKAYKNVICLGLILDEKGKKMSKSIGNIVDPWLMMEKYGVDTLRLWMYSVNQPGESKNFDEKTVAELHNKVFNLLYNVLAFYELYRDKSLENLPRPVLGEGNVLDQWILARLNQLTADVTTSLDSYKLLEPVRAIRAFIDELSTWYVRRSREALKDGDVNVKQTLYYVLKILSKLMAPFAPFAAEDIWQKLKNETDVVSVHLAEWPKEQALGSSAEVLEEMQKIREIVSLGLQARQKAGIPVRQPLGKLGINVDLKPEYIEIIKEELNIKEVVYDATFSELTLTLEITPELKKEGQYRELLRAVQDMRKKIGLMPSDIVTLSASTSSEGEELINEFKPQFLKTAGLKDIEFGGSGGEEIKIDELMFTISVVK